MLPPLYIRTKPIAGYNKLTGMARNKIKPTMTIKTARNCMLVTVSSMIAVANLFSLAIHCFAVIAALRTKGILNAFCILF